MSSELLELSKFNFSEEYEKYLNGLTEEQKKNELEETIKRISNNRKNILSENIEQIRKKRDELLIKTDYYFNVPDIKIDDVKKEQIIKYRQDLRDFPAKIKDEILYIDDKEINLVYASFEDLLQYIPRLNN
jgi:hypothetical protein